MCPTRDWHLSDLTNLTLVTVLCLYGYFHNKQHIFLLLKFAGKGKLYTAYKVWFLLRVLQCHLC